MWLSADGRLDSFSVRLRRHSYVDSLHEVAGICLATTPGGFPRVTLLMWSLTSVQRPLAEKFDCRSPWMNI